MRRHLAWAIAGTLAVCCIGMVFAAVYPFDGASPHAVKPAAERFSVPEANGYSATGRIVVDGDAELAFDGVVTPDGRWYQRVAEDGVVSEGYRGTPDGPVLLRFELDSEAEAEQRRERVEADDTQELLRYERGDDGVTLVVETNRSQRGNPVAGTASVFVRSLDVAGYEPADHESRAVAVYEPLAGWYGETEPYRLTAAAGEVQVDPETNAVESANVTWELTAPAGTYAEYLLVRLTSDEPRTYVVTVEFDLDDHTLEAPPWVDESRAG